MVGHVPGESSELGVLSDAEREMDPVAISKTYTTESWLDRSA
jgi:hypothetical protein